MAGQSYSSLKVGDPCWIIVNSANHPTGYWKGEVLEVIDYDGWWQIEAKITDGRVKDHLEVDVRNFFNRKPHVNYRVIPSNEEFDGLIANIQQLEKELQSIKADAAAREAALVEALEKIAQKSLTKEEIKEVILQK